MGENSPQIQENLAKELKKYEQAIATPHDHRVAMRAEEDFESYEEDIGENPSKGEVLCWYLYGLCSYFVHTVLIPIVFPLVVSQTTSMPHEPQRGWLTSYWDLKCTKNEMQLYEGLIQRSIKVSNMHFSPLEWTSLSWFTGLILSAPLLAIASIHLDYDAKPQLLPAAVTALGVIFCLPVGFFKNSWILPIYIAIIVVANTIGTAFHTRHLGLMIKAFPGSKSRERRAFGSYLSIYNTVVGCFGSAIFSSFTYYMLGRKDRFTALWVVTIFGGLKWGVGLVHIFTASRPGARAGGRNPTGSFGLSIFKYPYSIISLVTVFLSSFSSMCIFAGGVVYAIGYLCLQPCDVLFLWLTYFVFPLLSLLVLRPLQQIIRADSTKMKLLGFLLAALTSGFGFYFRKRDWEFQHLVLFGAVQGTATGLLHAFGRLVWLECSTQGKEGAFSAWFSWVRGLGTFAGFALATTAMPGVIGRSFGVAFWAAIGGVVILIFNDVTSFVIKDRKKASPAYGWDDVQQSVSIDTPNQGKV